MQQATLELRDIHLPEAISWWPIAPGWWLVLGSIIVLLIAAFIWRKLYLSKQLKRDIQAEFTDIKQQFEQTGNKLHLARELSVLLRRVSISLYPNDNIAGLTGEDWLQHLDASYADAADKTSFSSDIGKILITAPYLPADKELNFDTDKLLSLCENWLLASHKKAQHQVRT